MVGQVEDLLGRAHAFIQQILVVGLDFLLDDGGGRAVGQKQCQQGQYEHGAVGCEHDFEYTVFGTLSTVHDDPPPISPDFSHDVSAMKYMYCP